MREAVTIVDALELKQKFDQDGELMLLDVREDEERAYAAIQVPTTVTELHVPLGDVTSRLEEIREASAGRALVVYCHHGQRSMVAATWLVRQGLLNVANLEGGIDAWSSRVDLAVRRY